MKKIGPLLLVAFFVLTFMGLTRFGKTQFTQYYWGNKVEHVYAYTTVGPGSWVVWKTDSVPLLSGWRKTTTGVDTTAGADSCNWGPRFRIAIFTKQNTAQACTVAIIGDTGTRRVVDTVAIGAGVKWGFSRKLWTRFDTLVSWNFTANESIQAGAYLQQAVTTTTTANDWHVAGVMLDTAVGRAKYSPTGVDGYAPLLVDGKTYAYVQCGTTTGRPGLWLVTTTSAQYAIPVATKALADSAHPCGKLLDAGNTDGLYLVHVQTEH